jgi:nucleoside-diphosphate-sugar epimerase
MALRYLITGGTGFIGGHLADACVAAGSAVSTIARAGSDTALLERLGVVIHGGDLGDPQVVQKAVAGADVVVHCAAKVGDRGPVEDYRAVNVEGLRNLLSACKGRPLHRFVHLSSLGVYEARHHHGTDETEPAATQHWDGYTQSKAEAEQVAQSYQREHGVPVVILRPGFVYGPRDRAVLPKLIERLRIDEMHYLGGDQRALNTIYIANLADAVFLAVDNPGAVGQIYNLTDGEVVTKQRFINGVADGMGFTRPKQRMPRWLAGLVTRLLRWQMRRAGPTGKAWLTPAKYKFLLLNLDFSIEKARRELGYGPHIGFDQGIRETMAWYKQNA